MKIVYVTPDYMPHIGGIEKYVQELALHFKNVGNEITVITAERSHIDVNIEIIDGIRIVRIPVKSYSGILVVKRRSFLKIIDNEIKDSDIVHLNDCKFLYLYLAKRKQMFCYKLFLSSHGFIFHTPSHQQLKELFFKKVVVRNQSYYNKIICVSEQDANIAQKYGINSFETVFPGVDIKKFICSEKIKSSNPSRKLFYWGRIARNKGLSECLYKLAKLNTFDFNIVGKCEDDIYMQELKEIIEKNNLHDKVHFVGIKTDKEIKQYIEECDFILMPSLHEGFGMALAECLLSNRNIIANNNSSFIKILSVSNASRYLFDFISDDTNIEDKMIELETKRVHPINVEQFSKEDMFKKISDIYYCK